MKDTYFEEVRLWLLTFVLADLESEYHVPDPDDPNLIVISVPAPEAINRRIEIQVAIEQEGLAVRWFYPTQIFKDTETSTAERKREIAKEIADYYNTVDDWADFLVVHTMEVDSTDIFWSAYYPRSLYYPWNKETTVKRVFKDILFVEPARLQQMCFPLFAAMTGKKDVNEAIESIKNIRRIEL